MGVECCAAATNDAAIELDFDGAVESVIVAEALVELVADDAQEMVAENVWDWINENIYEGFIGLF